MQISANSLGNDFNKITKELNLENKICAHMFRHRFITNIFINLIKQYDIENKQGLKNALLDLNTLKAHVQELTGHKNYAFIHYLSKEIYPENYAPEVGVIILDDEKLEYFNIDKEEYIEKMGDFSFDNCYEDILFETFGLELDKTRTELIDKSQMFKDLKDNAIMDCCNIVENWENTYLEEFHLAEKAFLVALGQATYDIVFNSINENKNLLEGNK